ncbi:DNA invertase Pin-like site-specific DNA recombinase [Nonomuraea muscovyensis]|uniref:DNA invertase Pin-like site-specific DNA recombinase n=1 Tax=Nonomuraea muscovyensis TaxID=1124761 RepID=A0A7X0C666_9ACTN|nr:recombinase family protein [Nonomuraea muscovyensis]MBB6347846.1 DNA invertase Pin-like site-specific DNA recombinase [Nonomuraea muscovyensis]
MTKLNRLARSVADAHDIANELTARAVKLNLGGSIYDPTNSMGTLLFTVLAMVAEFEADLARMRTREGMKIAKAEGRLRGRKPKLNARQEAHLVALHKAGEHTSAELPGHDLARRRPHVTPACCWTWPTARRPRPFLRPSRP